MLRLKAKNLRRGEDSTSCSISSQRTKDGETNARYKPELNELFFHEERTVALVIWSDYFSFNRDRVSIITLFLPSFQ